MQWHRPGLSWIVSGLIIISTGGALRGAETDFKAVGPNLLAAPSAWTSAKGVSVSTEGTTKLSSSGGGAVFHTSVSVEPGQEYFFSVDVKSADRLVFFLGGLSMSYHRQGSWQTVCGLVRSNQSSAMDLKLDLRALQANGPAAEIRNLVLQKVERPAAVFSRERSGDTVLVSGGQARAFIIYSEKTGKTLAEKVQAAIQKKTGASLPLVSDRAATEAQAPTLKPEYRNSHLIIIGRLGTNRAFWPAYNRFLTAEDGYYPGGDGYVVRTAVDVFRNGKNHIILGGSSEEGVAQAANKFTEKIAPLPFQVGQLLTLPWTLEIELGGECLAAFKADEAIWQDPKNPTLPPQTPGYGTVTRWYRNAMGYYWSGWPSYLQRTKVDLKQILTERAPTHQYIVEFMLRSYGMLNESPVFDRKEAGQFDALILQNFLDFLTVTDLSWMTVFSPPYSEIEVTNRHQIAPWYSDLLMAQYLRRNVLLGGLLKELVEFRLSEKDAVFRAFAASRNGPSLPGIAANSDYEEFPATFFRFALENELYPDFLASGLAHQTLAVDRIDIASRRYAFPSINADISMWMGAMAMLTGDSRYQWLNQKLDPGQSNRASFQGRYVAGVHRYQPDADFPSTEPDDSWAGIQVAPQPHREDQTPEADTHHFPIITMRGGFKPEDDYLIVAGVNRDHPPGTLSTLIINGISFFGVANGDDGGAGSRSTTNGASVVRLDHFDLSNRGTKSCDTSAELKWKAQFPGLWAFAVKTDISRDMQWTRDLIRLASGQYIFCDTFKALRDGKYLLQVNWQPSYPVSSVGDAWKIVTNRAKLQVQRFGTGFSVRQTSQSLVWESTKSMKEGETSTVWTVVQQIQGKSTPWQVAGQPEDQIRLTKIADQRQLTIRRGPLETAKGLVIADLIISEITSDSSRCILLPQSEKHEEADIPVAAIEQSLKTVSAPSQPTAEVASKIAPTIANETSQWRQNWTYDGLLRPVRVTPTALSEGRIDFGRSVSLAEIRSTSQTKTWTAGGLPPEIFVAPSKATTAPEPSAAEWIKLETPRSGRAGAKTGNYGEATPVARNDESLMLKDIQTRFVKAAGAETLKYFTNNELAARHPVQLTVIRDLPGQKPFVLAQTKIFPGFPRAFRDDDFSMALLNPESGQPFSQIDINGPVQSLLIADQAGQGAPEIFVLRADVRIDVFALDGSAKKPIDLYALSTDFQKRFGRENTRGPAGGHYMPFSFGLWRTNTKGASKLVIGRYGSIAFLDENRQLEGILNFPSYASPVMLPKGEDFNGDGKDEILLLEKQNLIHVDGEATPVIRDPGGANFWPQVYRMSASAAEDAGSNLLGGSPVSDFSVIKGFGGKSRYVFTARGNYVGIYEASARRWILSWKPPAPISAASLILQTEQRLEFCLTTVDGLIWNVVLDARRLERPNVSVQRLPVAVNQIQASPTNDGTAIFATNEGLFLRSNGGAFSQVAPGKFTSAAFLNSDNVVAANQQGQVVGFSKR